MGGGEKEAYSHRNVHTNKKNGRPMGGAGANRKGET